MCGITGWFSSTTRYNKELLEAMCTTIAHRGPNAHSCIVMGEQSEMSNTGAVGLGHTRLSIIDVSDSGIQPMSDVSKRYWIVFNGEIYNFRELQEAYLQKFNIPFKSKTDTEVLLYLYIHYGEKCLSMLRGMFACVIYDAQEQTLFGARDRFGVKPFYYAEKSGCFAFGSELKSLYTFIGKAVSVNTSAVSEFLIQGYIGDQHSIITEAQKLEPAHYFKIAKGQTCVPQKYWELSESKIIVAQDSRGSLLTEQDEVESRLRESIKLRLVSDVPLGSFLSGGVDSSLVTILAQQILGAKVKTFSLGFKEAKFDEREYARAIAQHIGSDHAEYEVTNEDLLRMIPLLPRIYDEPFSDESAIPTLLLAEFAKKHVTVALSGDGGDEQFYGYTRYRYGTTLQKLNAIPAMLRRAFVKTISPFAGFDTKTKLSALTYTDWELAAKNIVNPFTVCKNIWNNNNTPYLEKVSRDSNLMAENRLMLTDLSMYMPCDILTKVDRATMFFGLEARVPLLDHLCVEFNFENISLQHKTGAISKEILKNIVAKYIPRNLIDRPKKGFAAPLVSWVNGPLCEQIGDALHGSTSFDSILNFQELQKMFNNKEIRASKYGSLLFWKMFVLLQWEQTYLKS